MAENEVRIAVVRAWNDSGALRIRVVFESPSGAERMAFNSADHALRAIRLWLTNAAVGHVGETERGSDGPVTP